MTKAPKTLGPVEIIKGLAKPETDAERLLLESVKTGEPAKIPGDSEPTDPDTWTEAQTIRANIIRHICLNPEHYEMDPKGIQIIGALIKDELNLQFAALTIPIGIIESHFTHTPNLIQCRLPALVLDKCDLRGLTASRMTSVGSVFLRKVTSCEEIRLLGAKIGGNLECNDASFINKDSTALVADQLTCNGNVFLNNVTAHGEVRLMGGKIDGNLGCTGANFTNKNGNAFYAQRLHVSGRFFWRGLKFKPEGRVDLMHTHVGDFIDDGTGWPKTGDLYIEGFTYDTLDGKVSAEQHIKWLNLMPKLSTNFFPQPYEHMIKILRHAGHEHDARKIAFEKQEAYRAYLKRKVKYLRTKSFADLKPPSALFTSKRFVIHRSWLLFFKWTMGFGYKPLKTLLISLFLMGLGADFYDTAKQKGEMVPSKERIYMEDDYLGDDSIPREYPSFNAIAYSIDTFIPFVDLHQETYWEPASGKPKHEPLRFYLWFHIAFGWILATMAAAVFTGLIKKD
ncbi:MAG: hypothetical protein COB46_05695 [Rhodospirillaceae bacterium]|nr:MAG: hypothetical protein COB46_05695 [Rhodospirillaceae bacterium]